MLVEFLRHYNQTYEVTPFPNAQEAISALESKKYDLYLLDIWLPDADGVELCREIRKTDSVTPIIIFSAIADTENMSKGLDAGADAYLTKPNDLLVLGPYIDKL